MLGRHVYRVSPLADGRWNVQKDGEAAMRGIQPTRDAAVRQAWELAVADEPSRLVVEGPAGTIADERLFGEDEALALEREVEAEHSPPPTGEPPSRR